MKKAKIIGKKTLSVFLAVLMVLTAWVWVAPTEASAINAGSYYYEVSISVTNDADGWNHSRVYLHYKGNNGQDSTHSTATLSTVSDEFGENSSIKYTGTVSGFPCGYTHEYSFGGLVSWRKLEYTVTIKVGASASSTLYQIFTASYTDSSAAFSSAAGTFGSTSNITATKPKATKVVWDATPSNFTIPSSTYGRTHCIDQYGVTLGVNPTNSFTSTPTTGLSGSTSNGTSYSQYTVTASNDARMSGQGTNSRDVTMTASYTFGGATVSDSKSFTITDPSYNVTLNANGMNAGLTTTSPISRQYGDKYNVTPGATKIGFTLLGFYYDDHEDSYETVVPNSTQLTADTIVTENHTWYAAWQANQYTMKFTYRNKNGEWVTSDEITEYFGRNIPFPTVSSPVNSGMDYTYTFTGWSPAHTTVQAVEGVTEYVAQYDEEVHYADKTALSEAIAKAEEKMNEQKYIDGGYTAETVAAFQSVLQQADDATDMIYLLSQQSAVDAIIKNLLDSINNLKSKSFIVMFVDEDGTILKDGYHFVEYGDKVEIPANPTQEPDADYHYEFLQWDSTLSDGLDACNYVTDDLRYIANFNAFPHEFTETVTPSTCTEDGVITKTCTCGFSYTVAGETAGHKWSTDYKELVPATCATKGTEAKCCTACGAIDESSKREIAVLGHNFGAYTEYTPATCFGKGAEIAECSRCGGKDVKEIAKKTHAYGKAEKIEKTCTTDGYTKEVCTLCGFNNIRDIDKATGHSISETTVHSTCVSSGYIKEYCASCDYEKTTILPTTGNHTYPEIWTKVSDATCVGHGVEKRVCTVCNAATETRLTAFAAHTEPADWTTEKEAWCGLEGKKVKDCTVCGKELATEVIPALSHNYKEYADGSYAETCTSAGAKAEKCSRCGDINKGVIDPLGHDWNAGETTAATCTSGAYKTYTCKRIGCGETRVKIINGSTALTHDFTGTETIIKAATCESDGHKTVQCKNCAATTTVIIPHNGHTWNAWTITKAATNTEKGSMTRTCSNNKCTETVEIPAGGHEWDNGTVTEPVTCTKTVTMVYKCINSGHANCTATFECTVPVAQHTIAQKVTPATCIKTGTVEAYCSVCDVNCEKPFSTTYTPVVSHTLNNGTVVAPTCTTSGYTLYECTVTDCEFSYKEYDENEPATGHTYESKVTTSAGCVTEGLKTFTCACGKSYTEKIPAIAHTYTKDSETTATCTTLGTETYKCSCGDSYTIYVGTIDKSNHSWKGWETVKEATNDSDGYKINECTDCGCKDIEIISATGSHIFNIKDSNASKAPTCTEDGYDVFKCSAHTGCTATSTVPVSKLGHNAVIKYTAPTCIATGNSKAVCATCTVTLSTVEIPATGIHDFSGEGVKVDATCTAEGTITYTCETYGCTAAKVEKFPAKGHDLTTKVNHPTCGENGSVVTTCANCDDPVVEKTVELAAKNHNWNNGEIKDADKATCTDEGTKTFTCTVCGATKTEKIPATGHSWSAWTETKATNTADGSWSRSCSNCKVVETLVIPRGHSLVLDTVNSKDATCKEAGKKVYICESHTDCGVTIKIDLPKLQHTVAQREILATCKEEGKVEAYCSVCNDILSTEVIPVKAHDFVAQTAVAPTCTTSGYTPYKCSDCGFIYNVYEGADALGHKYVGTVTTAADCTTEGEMTYTCQNDNKHTYTETIPAKGHNYVEDTTKATAADCVTVGTKYYDCSLCDSYYIEYVEAAKGHTWSDNWTVVREATDNEYGVEKTNCTVEGCDEELFRTTAPIGNHEFTETITTAATCTTNGLKTFSCSKHTNCSANYTETIPATGHKSAISYTAPTCISKGSTKIICSVVTCQAVIENKEIDVIAHNFTGAGVKVDPTCTAEGSITYTCLTDGCNETKVEKIPAKGHKFSTTIADATCYGTGSVITECTVCKENSVKTTTVLPMIEHTWGTPVVENATCTTDGKNIYTCAVCSTTKTEVIGKLGHNWGEWVKVDATNDADGSWTRTCKNDEKHIETVVIPKGDHEWDDGIVTEEASCTKTGTKVYKCKTHTGDKACGVEITITLDKLQHTIEHKTKDATCTTDGFVKSYCTVCDEKCEKPFKTTVIPATGHNYIGEVTKAPSCIAEGEMTYTCAHDSKHTYTEAIAKLQHTFELKKTVAATCTTKGYETYKCATCTESYVKFIEGEVTGHSYKTIENTATCTEGGKLTLKCEKCSDEIIADVPALGHDYVEDISSATTATCKSPATKTFECSRQGCDASYTISTGEKSKTHTYDENWTVVKDSTESSIGYKTKECTVCGQIEVATIEAKGEHQFTDGDLISSKVATCTENGYEIRKCSKHDDCGKEATITIEALGHTEETIEAVAATCEGTGSSIGIKCSVCDTVLDEPVILPALGHTWNDGEVTTQPTCKTEGVMTFKCTVEGCKGNKTTEIAVNTNAHVYSVTTTEATCTTPATTVYTCACGDKKTVVTDFALGHSWNAEKTIDKEATCTSTGIESTHCANCSATKDEATIPALEHKEKVITEVATCTTAGYSATVCEVCNTLLSSVVITNAKAHSWKTETKAATCTDCATETKTCNSCGITETIITAGPNGHTWGDWTIDSGKGKKVRACIIDGCDATEECPAPTSGHNWNEGEEALAATCYSEGEMTYTCEGCEICTAAGTIATVTLPTPKLAHTYETVTSPATCTDDGSVVVKCKIEKCGKVAGEATLPKSGHTLVRDAKSDKAATCTDIGWYEYKCNNDNCTYTEIIEIAKLGHSYSATATETQQPSCTENGSKKYQCSRCDEAIVTEIPALGHSFTKITTVNPTCTEKGYTIKSCSVENCGEKYVVADSFTDASGHKWSEWETVTPATNDAEGLKKHICTVENCGVVEYAPITMLGHQWNDGVVVTAAGCETTGTKEYTCIKENCPACNGTSATYTETIPATGHKMIENKVSGDCLVPSYSEWTCENKCGHAYIIVTGEADGHEYVEKSSTPVTCDDDGVVVSECSVCHDIKEVVTPKLGHNYVKQEKPATCTTSAYVEYTCINDTTHTYKEFKGEPDGHSLGAWTVTLKPTDTKDGTKERSCSKCDYKETQVVPANIHNIVEIENVAATCKTEGHITYKCNLTHEGYAKACDYSYTVTLPVIAHSLTTEKSEPDCDDAGYIRTKCNNDGCDYKTEITTAALGHNWNDGVKTDSTCLEKGNILYTCQRCKGTKTVELQLAQHSMALNTEASKEATCTSRGYETYYCTVDGCSYGYSILGAEPTRHQNKKVETTPSTCKMSGLKKTICKDCNTILSVEVLSLAEHTYSSDVKAPTCTEMGYIIYTCGVCGDTYKDNYKSVVPHDFNESIKDNVTIVEAKCETDGSKTVKCSACNAVNVTTIPATGHINTRVETVSSTCIKNGTERVICACGKLVSEKTLPLAEHSYEVTFENGVYSYTCKVEGCGNSYTETDTSTFTVRFFAADKKTVIWSESVASGKGATAPAAPSKGADDNYHYTFSEWDRDFTEITSDLDVYPTYEKEAHYGGAATCTEKAVCDECGTGYGETDASKHVIDTKLTPATCEKDGVLEYYCTENGCTYSKTEVIKKTGHSLGAWETYQNGNCATPTIKIRKCRNNGCKYYEQKESYGSHTWYIQPEVAPTCTTVGYSEYKYCTTCGMEIDSVVIPKLNHRDNDGDGNCDYCTYTEPVLKCSCMCHSSGFMKFIYSIVRFFWIITKSQPACNCGAKHY